MHRNAMIRVWNEQREFAPDNMLFQQLMWLIKIQSATGSGVLRFMGVKFPGGKELGDLTNPFTAQKRPVNRAEAKRQREQENDELAAAFARKMFGVELDNGTSAIN